MTNSSRAVCGRCAVIRIVSGKQTQLHCLFDSFHLTYAIPTDLGEITMWTAIAIATSQSCSMIPISSGSPSSFWTILGTHLGTSSPLKWAWLSPAFTAFLLLCVSGVPLVEKAGMKKWGKDQKYLEYVQTTPLLLPKAFLGLVFMFVGVVVFGLLRTQSRE